MSSVKRQRPLSPHLQVYRPQISSVLSITHRATGVGLSAGLLLLVWFLVALAMGEHSYNIFLDFLGSFFGKFLLAGFLWSLHYHMCNGIRHLFWDMGYGFKLSVMHYTGMAVVAASFVLTALVLFILSA